MNIPKQDTTINASSSFIPILQNPNLKISKFSIFQFYRIFILRVSFSHFPSFRFLEFLTLLGCPSHKSCQPQTPQGHFLARSVQRVRAPYTRDDRFRIRRLIVHLVVYFSIDCVNMVLSWKGNQPNKRCQNNDTKEQRKTQMDNLIATPYRVAVNTRSECIGLIKDLAAKGVDLRLKIEGSETHLTISKSQLVKYTKACRWFDYYSEMTIEVHNTRTGLKGFVRFNNEGWG